MNENLMSLTRLLATDDEFNQAFSSAATEEEKYSLSKSKFDELTREDFSEFMKQLREAQKKSLAELSHDEMVQISGGAGNLVTKLAATAMFVTALSAPGFLNRNTAEAGKENLYLTTENKSGRIRMTGLRRYTNQIQKNKYINGITNNLYKDPKIKESRRQEKKNRNELKKQKNENRANKYTYNKLFGKYNKPLGGNIYAKTVREGQEENVKKQIKIKINSAKKNSYNYKHAMGKIIKGKKQMWEVTESTKGGNLEYSFTPMGNFSGMNNGQKMEMKMETLDSEAEMMRFLGLNKLDSVEDLKRSSNAVESKNTLRNTKDTGEEMARINDVLGRQAAVNQLKQTQFKNDIMELEKLLYRDMKKTSYKRHNDHFLSTLMKLETKNKNEYLRNYKNALMPDLRYFLSAIGNEEVLEEIEDEYLVENDSGDDGRWGDIYKSEKEYIDAVNELNDHIKKKINTVPDELGDDIGTTEETEEGEIKENETGSEKVITLPEKSYSEQFNKYLNGKNYNKYIDGKSLNPNVMIRLMEINTNPESSYGQNMNKRTEDRKMIGALTAAYHARNLCDKFELNVYDQTDFGLLLDKDNEKTITVLPVTWSPLRLYSIANYAIKKLKQDDHDQRNEIDGEITIPLASEIAKELKITVKNDRVEDLEVILKE